MEETHRPIILGGGYAGIAAAVALADRGERPILLESRPFLGGRARSFHHAPADEEVDNGQHLMMGCYTATLALLEKLGTRNLVSIQPRLAVELRDESGPRLLRARALPPPLDVLAGMLALERLCPTERLHLLRAGLAARFGSVSEEETVEEWLGRTGQSGRLRRLLWHPLVIATMNTAPDQASAQLFLHLLRLSFLKGGREGSLAFPTAGLSHLIEPARDYLERRGGEVRTGSRVMRVERGEGQRGWRVLGRDLALMTDRLISALPWHDFASLFGDHLPEECASAIPAPQHNPILSLYLWYDHPLTDVPDSLALVGTEIEWVFNRRKIVPTASGRYPGLLSCVVSNAGEIGNEAAFVARVTEQIRLRIPEIGDAAPVEHLLIREKRATFAATPAILRRRLRSGRLISDLTVCGDWTYTELPGTIEGSVRGGVSIVDC